MSTRLALGLALVLLALALVQWWLRSEAGSMDPLQPNQPDGSQLSIPAGLGTDPSTMAVGAAGELEEPVFEIPEYVPPRVTERPRIPLGFAPPEVEIELEVPSITGDIDDDRGEMPHTGEGLSEP